VPRSSFLSRAALQYYQEADHSTMGGGISEIKSELNYLDLVITLIFTPLDKKSSGSGTGSTQPREYN
jgi:hypothetical protein